VSVTAGDDDAADGGARLAEAASGRARRAGVGAAAVLTAVATLLTVGLWLRLGEGGGLVALTLDWTLAGVVTAAATGVVGALVVRRRPRNLVGWWLVAASLLTATAVTTRIYATTALAGGALPAGDWAAWVFTWVKEPTQWLLVAIVLVFPHDRPTGRLRSRALRAVAVVAVIGVVTAAFTSFDHPGVVGPFAHVPNPAPLVPAAVAAVLHTIYYDLLYPLAGFVLPVVAAVVAIRRSSDVERLQWKVLLLGVFGLAVILVTASVAPRYLGAAAVVGLPAIPVAIGLAITRHRLYGIERLLGRTLAYGLTTAVLVGVYAVCVVGFRALLTPLGGDSDVVVAGSTLVVAALFRPLRRRAQSAVDRRFDRRRYDALVAVAAFGQRLRDELQIDEVTADLHRTVAQTLQPTTSSLWLRASPRS
jgi:hypothetical protein